VIGSAVVNKTEYKMLFIEIQLFTEIQCLHLYDTCPKQIFSKMSCFT
jgi:hypothetical protein